MVGADADFVREHLDESRRVLDEACTSTKFMSALLSISNAISSSIKTGHRLFIAGNGGSAADSQHIAGEFLSRLNYDRAPLPAVALTTDTSVMTAIGNDYGYEHVFERQVRGLGTPGDIFIGISTSGRSPNIVRALIAGRSAGLTTIGFTGLSATAMIEHCDLMLHAPSSSTPQIQQIHIVAAHAICGLVERSLFPRDR